MLPASDVNRSGIVSVIALTGLIVSIVYTLTFSRSVGWHDSAELAVTAYLLGASHAPGSPLHAVLGHLLATGFAEAHIGTTALSAVPAMIAAVLLAIILLCVTRAPLVAVLGACAYALSFQVWANAVVTELYSLGAACLGVALLAATLAVARPSGLRLGVCLAFYCLALAAYFGNIILWPVFAWFFWRVSGRRLVVLALFGLITGLAVVAIGMANMTLAANALPFGSVRPDSFASLLLYMSGSQHEPLQIRTPVQWLGRVLEHTEIFARSSGYVGVLAAGLGVWDLHRRKPLVNTLFAGVFLFYMGYYTIFGSGDYYLMVVPAYFIFYLWVGAGLAWVLRRFNFPLATYAAIALMLMYIGALLTWQLPGRMAMAQDRAAERFASTALENMPEVALAVVGYRELTTLSYFQSVKGRRADLTFILPARDQRFYLHGEVADYLAAINALPCGRAIYTNKDLADWPGLRAAEGELGTAGWYRLQRPACGE